MSNLDHHSTVTAMLDRNHECMCASFKQIIMHACYNLHMIGVCSDLFMIIISVRSANGLLIFHTYILTTIRAVCKCLLTNMSLSSLSTPILA